MTPKKIDVQILHTAHNTLKRLLKWPAIIRYPIALGLVIIGVLGIILPILPGWIFLLPGIGILWPRFGRTLEHWLTMYFEWRGETQDETPKGNVIDVKPTPKKID